jgi:hypothetical protein
MNTAPPGFRMHVSSLAYAVSLLALLTACGANADGKPIAGPVSAPSTAATVAPPATSSSAAATAVTTTAIPLPAQPPPALSVQSPPPGPPPTAAQQADNGAPGAAPNPNGGAPATITLTDAGPLTSGQVQVAAGVGVQDDYIYYPTYGVYFSGQGHQYHYQQHDGWVARPEPEGVSVDMLRASPSVPMDFHDAPSHHHAAVVNQYPKTWSPAPAREAPHNAPVNQHDEQK